MFMSAHGGWFGFVASVVVGSVTALAACSGGSGGGSGSGSCTAGASVACTCTNGAMGAQVCGTNGQLGACTCSGSASSGSGGGSGSGSGSGGSSGGSTSSGSGGSSGGSTGACKTASDCPPAQYAGVTQVRCTAGVCTYPGAFCNAGTSVCGSTCVCPAHSQNFGQGCVCNGGYQTVLCSGTPCSGSACDPDFKCAPVGGSSSSSGGGTGGTCSAAVGSWTVTIPTPPYGTTVGNFTISSQTAASGGTVPITWAAGFTANATFTPSGCALDLTYTVSCAAEAAAGKGTQCGDTNSSGVNLCPNGEIFTASFGATPTASQWFALGCSSTGKDCTSCTQYMASSIVKQ
jgi:hypothetical protein